MAAKANERLNTAGFLAEAGKLLATGAVAALATIVVGYFTFAKDSRELDIKMMDTALSILSGDKGGQQTSADSGYVIARTFALRALRKYSNVELSDAEIGQWAKADQPLKSGVFTSGVSWGQILKGLDTNILRSSDGVTLTMNCFTRDEEIDALSLPDTTLDSWQAALDVWQGQYCHAP